MHLEQQEQLALLVHVSIIHPRVSAFNMLSQAQKWVLF